MERWTRLITTLALALLPITDGFAGTYNLNSKCTLQRYNGRAWEPVPASVLRDRIRDPLTQKGGKALFRIGALWFMTDPACLTRNQIDPLERREGISEVRAEKQKGEVDLHRWGLDLGIGYAMLSGQRFKEQTTSAGGYAIATTGVSSAIPLSLGVSYRMSDSLLLRYFFTRMKTSQTGQYSGSVAGKAVYEHDFYHLGLSAIHSFEPRGKLRPFAGIDVGYAIDSGLYTLSGFEGIFAGLNGGVDVNSSGFFFGARGGADWQWNRQWSVYADLGYQLTLYGDGKVNASTTSFYTAGGTVPYSSGSRILLTIGVRYWL